jgi:hypothetical protein
MSKLLSNLAVGILGKKPRKKIAAILAGVVLITLSAFLGKDEVAEGVEIFLDFNNLSIPL